MKPISDSYHSCFLAGRGLRRSIHRSGSVLLLNVAGGPGEYIGVTGRGNQPQTSVLNGRGQLPRRALVARPQHRRGAAL